MNKTGTMVKPAPADESPNNVVSTSEEFREGGYGWVCVACTAIINAHTWGINAVSPAFSPFYSTAINKP